MISDNSLDDNLDYLHELDANSEDLKNSENVYLKQLIDTETFINHKIKHEIEFVQPLIKQNNKEMIYPRTINIIQGQAGSHKSRLAQTICSAIIKKDGQESIIKLDVDRSTGIAVCYIDTERNIQDQLPFAMQQTIIHSGNSAESKPQNLRYTSMISIPRENRLEVLKTYLDYLINKESESKKHYVIVLDVLTDFVKDFNQSHESLKALDILNDYINNFDVTFICLIHENPGANRKARGHLGTELTNKASTILEVKVLESKEDLIIEVNYIKCRLSEIHKSFHLKLNESTKALELVEDHQRISIIKTSNTKAPILEIQEYIISNLREEQLKTKFIEKVAQHFNCDPKTIKNRLKGFNHSEFQFKDNSYKLIERKLKHFLYIKLIKL